MSLVTFWFIVITVVWVGFFLLEGFDFGVGMLHEIVGRDEAGRRTAIATIGPVWDGNEVWLVLAAAGTFAAFPGWYATMFSAFYPLFLVILVGLILRGVSFEFRSHSGTERARRFWDGTLTFGSLFIPLLLGVVLGGLLRGVPINGNQEFVGDLADLLHPYAIFTGVTITVVCLLHGAVFLALRTLGEVRTRAVTLGRWLGPVAVAFVLGFCIWTRVEAGGFFLTLVELAAILAAIIAAALAAMEREGAAFAATSATVAAVVLTIFTELFPRVMVSSLGAGNDLTTHNTASAHYALTVMTVVLVILLPLVLAYQSWSFYVFRRRLGGPRPPGGGPAVTPRPGQPQHVPVAQRSTRSSPAVRLAGLALAVVAARLRSRSRSSSGTTS